jgi:hypothetical protein
MTTPFENFVNIALGKSLSADVTLPTANDIPVFTGIGRQVTGKTTAELGLATTADSRYQFVSSSGATYTVPASAVTANGNTIIELSNNSLTSITINAATATGKTAGDSVTIHITGTYAAQILVASGITLNGTLAFSAYAKIKTLIYRGSNLDCIRGLICFHWLC